MQSLPRSLLAAAAFAGVIALPGAASAAVSAFATGNVNMRTCGSTSCPKITTVPVGAPVAIYGCTPGYGWCDTQYGNYRGWVSGRYLRANAPGYAAPSPVPAIGALLGIAILGGAIANSYDYNHYGYGYGYGYPRPPQWRPPYYRPGYPVRPPRGGVSPGYPGRGGGVSPGYPGRGGPGTSIGSGGRR